MAIPNWIKVEQTTPDKPEVVQMSSRLRIDQDAVVGKLFRLWSWADQNAVADCAEVGIEVTEAFIDRLTNRRGFEAALVGVNWARRVGAKLVLINFTRHNGETAKERAQTNRRVAELRQRNVEANKLETQSKRNCNASGVTSSFQKRIPEEEEEEDKNPLNPPPAGESAASHASAKAPKRREGKMRGRRLPDLKTLRDNLAELKTAIGDLRRPGGCAFDRRPEEMSRDNLDRLAKLCREAEELENTIDFVRGELGRRVSAKAGEKS